MESIPVISSTRSLCLSATSAVIVFCVFKAITMLASNAMTSRTTAIETMNSFLIDILIPQNL